MVDCLRTTGASGIGLGLVESPLSQWGQNDLKIVCRPVKVVQIKFFKDGPLPVSFSLFRAFLLYKSVDKILPMSGYELQISGVRRECSTS